jgi:hypothetical protein
VARRTGCDECGGCGVGDADAGGALSRLACLGCHGQAEHRRSAHPQPHTERGCFVRKTSLLVITWMFGTTLAVGLALQGVSLFDSQFVEDHPNAKSQSAVRAEIRSAEAAAAATEAATTTVEATTTTAATTTTTAPTTTTAATEPIVASTGAIALGPAGRPRVATTTSPPPILVIPEPTTPETIAETTTTVAVVEPPPVETAPSGPPRVVQRFPSLGGSIDVGFDGVTLDLAAVTPAEGYTAETVASGPAEVKVTFTNSEYRKTIRVRIEAGILVDSISVRRLDR